MYSEGFLFAALRECFPAREYALLPQVGNSTGGNHRAWADAVAVNLWPTRGLEIHGFEMKVSRSDWKRELAKPEKAEAVAKHCDRWWIVTSSEKIVEEGELPPTWGLIVWHGTVDKGKLAIKVPAPKLTPVAIDRGFLAAVLRRVWDASPSSEALAQARAEAEARGRVLGAADARYRLETLDAFEKASGVKLDGSKPWEGGNIGEAVKLVLASPIDAVRRDLQYTRERLEATQDLVARAIKELPGDGR